MKQFLIAMVLCVTAMPASAATVFKCKTLDGVEIDDGGKLVRETTVHTIATEIFPGAMVDTQSGLIKVGDYPAKKWLVLRGLADQPWNFVATLPPAHGTIPATPSSPSLPIPDTTETIRLYAEPGEPVLFSVMFEHRIFLSGTCEAVR
jgi:hypothetical protein